MSDDVLMIPIIAAYHLIVVWPNRASVFHTEGALKILAGTADIAENDSGNNEGQKLFF